MSEDYLDRASNMRLNQGTIAAQFDNATIRGSNRVYINTAFGNSDAKWCNTNDRSLNSL
jgi:hypothetical protein